VPVVLRAANAGSLGDVFEPGAAAKVAQQSHAAHAGYRDVVEAIVVEVADRDAHSVELHRLQARAGCRVTELTFAVVEVERERGTRLRALPRPCPGVDEY